MFRCINPEIYQSQSPNFFQSNSNDNILKIDSKKKLTKTTDNDNKIILSSECRHFLMIYLINSLFFELVMVNNIKSNLSLWYRFITNRYWMISH